MSMEIKNIILAAVTINRNNVGGAVPIFYAQDEEEMQKLAGSLANIVDGMVHELVNGTLIVVKH